MFLEILSVEAFTEKYLYLEGLSDVAYKPMQAPIKPPERFVLRLTASTPRAISIQPAPYASAK